MPEIKPKPATRVEYEVTFTPALATRVFDFMSNMDLGISGGEYPVTYKYTWTTVTKTDAAYFKHMEKAIKLGLKANGVSQIHSIKRVK